MNTNSRTNNVVKNIIGGVGGQIFTSILSFVCRTYFINLLGKTYLGVNGLFANILSMLSLAELGIGPAIVFSMYKPIAENDELHVAKLMNFYKSAYRIIACVVAVIGCSLVPFLDAFIKDTKGIENLRLIFILILSNTVVSYLYAFKGSMLNADQKAYVVVIIRNIFAVIQNVAQILVLIWTGNFILYLITQIVTTFTANFIQAIYVDKKYPFLVKYKKEKIDKNERNEILKKVRGMMMHKLGGFVLNGTDNLVISKFIGIAIVGIYSNYLMIINLVKTYVAQVTGALSASVGNLIASETKEKSHDIFEVSMMVYFWIYSLCFIAFWTLFQPFIEVWLDKSFLLGKATVFIVLLNFYLDGFQGCINTFTNATGLFWETRHKPILECIINIVVSVILAIKIGIVGVFIGTFASYISVFWINPLLVYKKQFNRSSAAYFIKFIIYTALNILTALGIERICNFIPVEISIFNIFIRVIICAIIPNILFVLLFFKTKEFQYCLQAAKNIIKRRR